jgi:hypothetical protein
VPILGLERKFSIERPLETGEQKAKQNAANLKNFPSAVV